MFRNDAKLEEILINATKIDETIDVETEFEIPGSWLLRRRKTQNNYHNDFLITTIFKPLFKLSD